MANLMANLMTRRSVILSILAVGVAVAIPATLLKAADKETMSALDAFGAAKSGRIILVDIRTPDEWKETGVGEGAIGLDMRSESFVTTLSELRAANPDTPIALICRTGNRSNYVVTELNKRGFVGLVDVTEGMAGGRNGAGWIPQGLPTYAGNKSVMSRRRAAIITP